MKGIVVGTHGIGKFVAQRLSNHGLEVTDIAGTTEEHVDQDVKTIAKMTGREPQGHMIGDNLNALEEIIKDSSLRFAVICAPDRFHYRLANIVLRSDAYVMLEKPMLWYKSIFPYENLEKAKSLIEEGRDRLTVNTQLVSLVNLIWERYDLSNDEIVSFSYEQLTNGDKTGSDILVDLMPHALSILIEAIPGDIKNIRHDGHANRQRLEFDYDDTKVSINLTQHPEKQKYLKIGINGYETSITPKVIDGQFGLEMVDNEGETFGFPDPLDISMRHFANKVKGQGSFLVNPDDAQKNMELLSKIMTEVYR